MASSKLWPTPPKQDDLFARRLSDYDGVVISDGDNEPYIKILGQVTVGLEPGYGTALAQVDNYLAVVRVKIDWPV